MERQQEETAEVEQTESPEVAEPEERPEGELEQTEEPEADPEADASEEGAEEAEPEADPAAVEAEKAAAAATAEKRRRRGGWERKVERLEREREILLQQLAGNRPAPAAAPAPEKPKDAAEQAREYIRAEARAMYEEEKAREQQARDQVELQKRMSEAKARYDDFDDVLEGVAHIPVPKHIEDAILTSPAAPDIMYLLAKNPAELARIARLPPLQAARELGRLEAKASSTPTPKAQPKPAARPPAPPTNVRGKAASTGEPSESLSMSDYKRAFRSKR